MFWSPKVFFMSSGIIFWDDILGWYFGMVLRHFGMKIYYFLFQLFWTKKNFVYFLKREKFIIIINHPKKNRPKISFRTTWKSQEIWFGRPESFFLTLKIIISKKNPKKVPVLEFWFYITWGCVSVLSKTIAQFYGFSSKLFFDIFENCKNYHLSEEIILVSIKPKYDARLFIELQVQRRKLQVHCMLCTSNCSECQNKKQFDLHNVYWTCCFLTLNS
jgi:hypothetical protein